ncbi:retrotransposon protein, putative, ty1-copia subclass [Tanacetum coccineum]
MAEMKRKEWRARIEYAALSINLCYEKQAGVERYAPIQLFLLQTWRRDLSVGLILNGLTSDFTGFVRNYNMHNMGKTIGELHVMLIEYEKSLPKMAKTPQVMMIKGGKIQKANKKSLKAKGKGKANGKGKDKHGYICKPKNPKPTAKEYPAKEARKLKQGALYLYVGNGVRLQVEAIGSFDLVLPNGLVICLDNCHYAPSITRGVDLVHRLVENGFLQQEGLLRSTDDESFDQCVSCLSGNMTWKSFPHRPERATDLLGIIHTDVCGPLRRVSRQGASYFITFTDDYSRYGYVYLLKRKHEVFETFKVFKNEVENQLGKTIKALRSDRESATRILNMVWGCEALVKQDKPDKLQQRSVKCIFIGYPKETMGYYFYFPPENKIVVASEIPMEVEGFEPPQEEVIPIRRSERTHRAPERLCLNVEVEEHSIGDLNEPTSYKAAMLDPESGKWIDAMNAEMQSMIDNMVWVLVDLPPNCKTVGSKWLFKIKTDMDGNVHTYKARLVAKGYTQLYGLIMKKCSHPSSPRHLSYRIESFLCVRCSMIMRYGKLECQNCLLNGLLYDKDIYYGTTEGFVGPNHPRKIILESVGRYEDSREAAFTSWNHIIYRDKSKRLIGLSQNAYMDKILKRYRMDNSKRGHIPMQERLDLNNFTRCQRLIEEADLRVDCFMQFGFETDLVICNHEGYVSFLNEAQ